MISMDINNSDINDNSNYYLLYSSSTFIFPILYAAKKVILY